MRDTKRKAVWSLSRGDRYLTLIYAGRTGWTIEYRSRVQGERTGQVLHVPYFVGAYGVPRGADLYAEWNATMSKGEALARWAVPGGAGVRTLRRGEVVR